MCYKPSVNAAEATVSDVLAVTIMQAATNYYMLLDILAAFVIKPIHIPFIYGQHAMIIRRSYHLM